MTEDFSEGDVLTDEDLVRLAEFFASDNVHAVSQKATLAIAELQRRRAAGKVDAPKPLDRGGSGRSERR